MFSADVYNSYLECVSQLCLLTVLFLDGAKESELSNQDEQNGFVDQENRTFIL